jgi:hypothetical protein
MLTSFCVVLFCCAGKDLNDGSVLRPRSLAKCLKIRCFGFNSHTAEVRKQLKVRTMTV